MTRPLSLLSMINDLATYLGEPPLPRVERVGRPVGFSEETLREAAMYAKEFEEQEEWQR